MPIRSAHRRSHRGKFHRPGSAWSLRERKLEVYVVGKGSLPLEKILGRELGNLIRQTHEANGVKFHFGRTPAAIQDRHVQLDDGMKLDCDLVVVGIGVRPNTKLAEEAGIATDNGVLVNKCLETNVPGIFAAGDIARWRDPRAGRIRVEHWVVAQRRGQTAARNMLGAHEPFVVAPFFLERQQRPTSRMFFSCRSRTKKIATKQRQRGELDKMKSRIGTRDHLAAAACGQPRQGAEKGRQRCKVV